MLERPPKNWLGRDGEKHVELCLDAGQSVYSLALISVDMYFRANVTDLIPDLLKFRVPESGFFFRTKLCIIFHLRLLGTETSSANEDRKSSKKLSMGPKYPI